MYSLSIVDTLFIYLLIYLLLVYLSTCLLAGRRLFFRSEEIIYIPTYAIHIHSNFFGKSKTETAADNRLRQV